MVTGEDGLVFCYANDIEEDSVDIAVIAAHYDYPCAQIYVEIEGSG